MHVLADVLHWAVVSSLRASVLAMLVFGIAAVGRRWLRPGLAYVLWALVLLLLALPRIPASPLSIYSLLPPAASTGVLAPVERAVIGGSLLTSSSGSAGAHPGTPSQAGAAKASDASSTGVPSRAAKGASGAPSLPAWQLALVSLWLAGIVFLLGRVAAAERRLRLRLRHAHPVTDARVLGVWSECRGAAARRMAPTIAEVEGIPSPVLLGVIRPRVLLPEGLAARLTDQELRHILVHELVHHRRRDLLVNWLGALLTIVHWFNPLVWWSARRLAEAQELACDAAAMGRLRTEEPASYGRTLVRVLELTRFEDPRVPSVAGIMRSGSLTKRRIQMIHLFKGPGAKWSMAGGGAVVVALAIVAMTRSGLPVSQKANGTGTACAVPTSEVVSSATTTVGWTSAGNSLGSGSPFLLNLGGDEGGPVGVQTGQPVPLAISVSHSSTQPDGAQPNKDALATPLPLRVCIYAVQPEHANGVTKWVEKGAPLWSFTPPALTPAQSTDTNMISFSWNTVDAKGNPLPPGVYFAQLAFPSTIQYVADGQTRSEALAVHADTAEQQYFALPIFLGGPNPQPPMNPQIRALASAWDQTIYVPATLPGSPSVTVSSPAPPPGMPRALIGIMSFGITHPEPGVTGDLYSATEVIPLGSQPSQSSSTPAEIAQTQPNAKLIHVSVAGEASLIPAVVYGSTGTYEVEFNIGKAGLQFQAPGLTEAQIIAAAQHWTPVLPVEPS